MVVFSGEGDKAFVSGADISQFEDLRAQKEAVKRYEQLAEAALQGIYEFAKPTVACIRGYCIGGGVNVAISCDLRVAASDSVFSIPATRLGLGYRFSAMKNLVQLVGPGFAKDIFFTGRRLDAAEALAHRARQPRGGARGASRRCLPSTRPRSPPARRSPSRRASGSSRRCSKLAADFDADLCQRLILDCFESEDYAEGRKAFMEKRKPVFKGK